MTSDISKPRPGPTKIPGGGRLVEGYGHNENGEVLPDLDKHKSGTRIRKTSSFALIRRASRLGYLLAFIMVIGITIFSIRVVDNIVSRRISKEVRPECLIHR